MAAGVERLRAGGVDLVLLDLGLPGSAGIETVLRLFRQAPHAPTLIVLSGLSDEEVAVQALEAGAQDDLIKGQIDAALQHAVRTIRHSSEHLLALINDTLDLAKKLGDAYSRSQGTGLGLSICRQLARLMGGEIAVDGEPGAGNRFRFCVDAAAAWPGQPSDEPVPLALAA